MPFVKSYTKKSGKRVAGYYRSLNQRTIQTVPPTDLRKEIDNIEKNMRKSNILINRYYSDIEYSKRKLKEHQSNKDAFNYNRQKDAINSIQEDIDNINKKKALMREDMSFLRKQLNG